MQLKSQSRSGDNGIKVGADLTLPGKPFERRNVDGKKDPL